AFALLTEPGQILWGRGLGGIGVGQNFGEWAKSDAADNLMVYLLVTFGMLGIAYVVAFLFRFANYTVRGPRDDLVLCCVRGWTALWFGYGLTTNMIEEPMMNLTIGVVFGTIFGVAASTSMAPRGTPAAARPEFRLAVAGRRVGAALDERDYA